MKAKVVVIIGFVIAFSAGLVAGLRIQQPKVIADPGTGKTEPPKPKSWLARQLNLTPEQDEQVKKIWEAAMRSQPDRREDPRQLFREREEAVAALIAPEDKPAYDKIMKEFSDKMSRSGRDREKAFEAAVAQTKAVLTAEQVNKYEELLKKRGPGDGHRGGRDGDRGRRGDRGPDRGSTRPSD